MRGLRAAACCAWLAWAPWASALNNCLPANFVDRSGQDDVVIANEEDIKAILALPGVVAASPGFSFPLARSGWQTAVTLTPGEERSIQLTLRPGTGDDEEAEPQ